MMIKWFLMFLGIAVLTVSCAKKPEPEPEPEPVVEPEPEPEPIAPPPPPPGPSPEELLRQRIEALLSQIMTNKVYFDFNRFELREEAKEILAEVGRLMTAEEAGQAIAVKVQGHTDHFGTDEYNLALGEKRARKVMDYLETYGVGPDRLTIISYGEEQPVAEGDEEEVRQQNRRAEFEASSDR